MIRTHKHNDDTSTKTSKHANTKKTQTQTTTKTTTKQKQQQKKKKKKKEMSFGTVLALVFVLIMATNGQQINPAQQQVLLDIYNSCSPNCPSQILSGSCDFASASANQCSCSYITCESNGNITILSL